MAITNDEYEENFCEFEEGDIYAEGFGLVASLVMRDKSISSMAKALYAYLMTFSNRSGAAWPSTNLILEEMSLSKNSFYKYRSELRDAGFLDWTTFGREGGGRRTVYRIFKSRKKEKKFSTNPRSEQYPKICAIASEEADRRTEMWKTGGGKPTNSPNFGTTNSSNSELSTLNNTNGTSKNSTTSCESDSQLDQSGTAIAEPVVAAANAAGSKSGTEKEKSEEESLDRDAVDAAFAALEARSLRRTKAASSLKAAKTSYRRLVREGHSPEEISDVYDHYVRWVKANMVQHPMGLAAWFERDDGWKLNYTALMAKRAAAEKRGSAAPTANPSTAGEVDDAEYRRRCQAVGMIDDDAEYRLKYAEQSNDEHLRRLAALVRAEKPVTLGNGLVDERLSRRPTYLNLWSRTNRKEPHRDYVLWCYQQLKTEGKVR